MQFLANRKLSHLTTAAMVAFVVMTAAALFAVVSLQTRADVESKALTQLQSNVRTFVGILRGSIDSLAVKKDADGAITAITVNDDAVFYSDELAERVTKGRAIDAGPLASSRALEGMTAVIVNVNKRYKAHAGLRVTGVR